MISRYGCWVLLSVLFSGLVSAQDRVQETRLLVKSSSSGTPFSESSASGSKLFAYTRGGRDLVRIDRDREVPILKPPFEVDISQNFYDVQVSRDGSRIVFGSGGPTHHYLGFIHSVRPDGSQLKTLVKSGDDCGKFIRPGYGSPFCSVPSGHQLSPDGQRVLFINKVREWDETSKENYSHYYLSMIPVTGGPIVRLEEVGRGPDAVWSEDGASIYYISTKQGYDPWHNVPRRYDLETGRSAFLTDASWHVWPPGLAVSRGDGALHFIAKQGFVRLDPETGVAEVVSEEHFKRFDLSPDGRWAVGIKEGDLTLIDLEFLSSAPLQVEPGSVDELALGQIPADRERWVIRKMNQESTFTGVTKLASQARNAIGVKRALWIDNERLWCMVQEDADPTRATNPKVRVGIVRLY